MKSKEITFTNFNEAVDKYIALHKILVKKTNKGDRYSITLNAKEDKQVITMEVILDEDDQYWFEGVDGELKYGKQM